MNTANYTGLSKQYTAEREFDLVIGRETPPYHAGACARDTTVSKPGQVERIVIGRIRINRQTGQIVD